MLYKFNKFMSLVGLVVALFLIWPLHNTCQAEEWIAFQSNRDGDDDIWAIRPDGTGLRQLTNLPGGETLPQWSPDSTKIVYAMSHGAEIWVYDWFAGTNTKIYLGSYRANCPAWSPDGSKILFREDASYNNPHITVINADGTQPNIVPVQSGYVTNPSWCPTGTAFVYNRRNSGSSSSEDLWIYDFTATGDIMNGTNHRLTGGASSESTTKYYADWTPSGDIVFVWGHNLVLINPGQSPNWTGPVSDLSDPAVTLLTNDASYPSIRYLWPSWSPDLSQIVYGYYSANNWDLWVMDAFGGNRYPLIATSYDEACPDWGNPNPIEEILDFIEDSVADETLAGEGPGKSAEGRLGALINMIEAAGNLIEAELFIDACQQLQDAYNRTDGNSLPPDFVIGDSASELASKIQELMTSLGCE